MMVTKLTQSQANLIYKLIYFLNSRNYTWLGDYDIEYIKGCMNSVLISNEYNDYQKVMFNHVRTAYINSTN